MRKIAMRSLLFVLCLGLLAQANPPQVKEVGVKLTPGFFSDEEEKGLVQKLREAPEFPMRFKNGRDAAVEILDASVQAVNREARYYATDDGSSAYVTDYVMRARVMLRNTTPQTITGVALLFTNSQSHSVFFVSRPKVEMAAGGSQQIGIDLMAIAGNPAALTVEITAINLHDYSAGMAMGRPDNPAVDSKPQPLNHLRPNYTELARANKVSGAVRLWLRVGADGTVKKVEVINALPDGLTEEAIRLARVLQFQPAMSNGVAVAYTVPIEIVFTLF